MLLPSVLVLPLVILTAQRSSGEVVKSFKVDRITICESADQYPVFMLPEWSITTNAGVNSFNCTLRISEEIKGPLKYVANIKRCEMDLSKCEFFNMIEEANLCGRFSDGLFQRGFLNSVTPPLACPVQPGDYRFTDNKWDMSLIANLPGTAYRWKIIATTTELDTGRVVFCSEMMSRILVTRKKGNRTKH